VTQKGPQTTPKRPQTVPWERRIAATHRRKEEVPALLGRLTWTGLVQSDAAPYEGQRVELSATVSRQFLNFLERKLAEHEVVKVVPDKEVLAKAYRLAYRKAAAQTAIDEVMKRVAEQKVDVPENLARKVAHLLRKEETESWDDAIAIIAGEASGEDDERGGLTRRRGR
jgi:hypothetical protein